MATLWIPTFGLPSSITSFEEYPNSPMISGTGKDRTFTRVGIMDWVDIDQAWAEAFPIAPLLPAAFPGNANFRVDTLSMKPLASGPTKGVGECELSTFGVAHYEKCEISITYKTTPYDDSTRRQLTINFGVEVQTVPSAGLFWGDNGERCDRLDIPMNVRVPVSEVSDTYYKIPSSSYATLLAAIRFNIGKVNGTVFNGSPVGTLLFTGSQVTFDFDASGNKEYTANHRFSEKNVENLGYGWNHFLDPDTGLYRTLFFDSQGNIPAYQLSNGFSSLFP